MSGDVELYRWDRRRVDFALSGYLPVGSTLAVSLDDGETWHELQRDSEGWWAWVAGPDATGNADGTIVAPVGRSRVLLRATSSTQIATDDAGYLRVLSV